MGGGWVRERTRSAWLESEGVCVGDGAIMGKTGGFDQVSKYVEDNGGQVSNNGKGDLLIQKGREQEQTRGYWIGMGYICAHGLI